MLEELTVNASVIEVDLSGNNMDRGVAAREEERKRQEQVVGDFFVRNNRVKVLRMRGCGIGDIMCGVMMKGLQKNKHLEKMDLSSNLITTEGATAISKTLIHGYTTLKSLKLSSN